MSHTKEVARINALKPKTTKGEESLFGADMAPIVRLVGQASSAIEDAHQVILGYREESGLLPKGAEAVSEWDVVLCKAAESIYKLRDELHGAQAGISRRAIDYQAEDRKRFARS